ncbi:hypothetical protein K435DRAFT_703135, partial [Dendrothele bispora CBS 962.96]
FLIPPLLSSWNPPNPMLVTQLNIFAGQLYLHNWETYEQLCTFLGLYLSDSKTISTVRYENDGFIKPEHQSKEMNELCTFKSSLLSELKELFGMRQKENEYAITQWAGLWVVDR